MVVTVLIAPGIRRYISISLKPDDPRVRASIARAKLQGDLTAAAGQYFLGGV
jgi:hypothetical protein